MKRIVLYSLLVVFLFSLVGCSNTRKAVKATSYSQSQATAQQVQTDERQKEQQHTANTATTTEKLDLSNVVIEFEKVEYMDGYEELPIGDSVPRSSNVQGIPATRNRNGKSKPPNGVRSVTSGRITINGNRSEKTSTEAKQETASEDWQRHMFKGEQQEATSEKATEKTKVEKPSLKAILTELGISCALLVLAFLFLRYKVRQYNRR